MVKLKGHGQTDVGLRREINQDSILVNDAIQLYVVADGMGGHRGGEVASAIAIDTLNEIVEYYVNAAKKLSAKEILGEAIREASARIFHKSSVEDKALQGMGTTVVALFAFGGQLAFGNVGDSRAYLWRSEGLWQITEDHSLINEQIRAGIIEEADAQHYVGRNVITRSVGFEREVVVDVLERQLSPGEVFMLCSDGLCGLVPDSVIAGICSTHPAAKWPELMIEVAKSQGGDDNISVIAIEALPA